MISEDDLPITYNRRGLPAAGRVILVIGGIYSLWVWLSSLEPSWTMPLICACWFIPAIAAPLGGRTIIGNSGIVQETRWLWGNRVQKFPAEDFQDVDITAVRSPFGKRDEVYVLRFQTSHGKWRSLASYPSRAKAEDMEAVLRNLIAKSR